MKAFHNDEKIKLKYVTRMKNHIAADNLIRGTGWEDGRGCAVGCTLEKYDHEAYETELGLPEWLARLEDTVFENVSKERAMKWPLEFLEAVNIGSDLEQIKTPFLIFILEQNLKTLDSLKVDAEFKEVISAIDQTKASTVQMIEAHKNGDDLSAAWSAAWSARSAWSAAESAESAAWSAAWSAAESAAWSARSARSARSAAWSAAESAESAAWSAAESAESAAWSAAWSAAESAAWSARSARSAAFEMYADKLLELIRGCK